MIASAEPRFRPRHPRGGTCRFRAASAGHLRPAAQPLVGGPGHRPGRGLPTGGGRLAGPTPGRARRHRST